MRPCVIGVQPRGSYPRHTAELSPPYVIEELIGRRQDVRIPLLPFVANVLDRLIRAPDTVSGRRTAAAVVAVDALVPAGCRGAASNGRCIDPEGYLSTERQTERAPEGERLPRGPAGYQVRRFARLEVRAGQNELVSHSLGIVSNIWSTYIISASSTVCSSVIAAPSVISCTTASVPSAFRSRALTRLRIC
jgi:hypothetical protein